MLVAKFLGRKIDKIVKNKVVAKKTFPSRKISTFKMNTFWRTSNNMNTRADARIMIWFLEQNHFINFVVDLD